MHSLIGCHVVGCNGEKLPFNSEKNGEQIAVGQGHAAPGTDIVNDTLYYILAIKLSEKFKRIFYFQEKEEREYGI